MVADLKVARERLAQDPSNSSRPPSSRAPWEAIDDAPAHTASCTLDLVRPEAGFGLVLQQTRHVYLEGLCDCGHRTRALPSRCAPDDSWTVALSEWYLAGPSLVAFICALTQRMLIVSGTGPRVPHRQAGLVQQRSRTITYNPPRRCAGRRAPARSPEHVVGWFRVSSVPEDHRTCD